MVLSSADRLSILDIALESGTLAAMLDVIKGKGFKKQHMSKYCYVDKIRRVSLRSLDKFTDPRRLILDPLSSFPDEPPLC